MKNKKAPQKELVVRKPNKVSNPNALRKPSGMPSMTFKALAKELAWAQNTTEEEKLRYLTQTIRYPRFAETEEGELYFRGFERTLRNAHKNKGRKPKGKSNEKARNNGAEKRNKWKVKSQ